MSSDPDPSSVPRSLVQVHRLTREEARLDAAVSVGQ
jgi:hypothetical protein